jgi:cytochrome oxidase Cu insertion factor (SCO1/SenC/PrrC family)
MAQAGLVRLLCQTTFRALVIAAIVSATSFASATLQSRQTTAAVDVTTLGPQVGEKVPDFSLPDPHGQTRTLASLMGPKGLVLVFSRSADW